ncbi:MAG: hypothetical protein AAF960_16870 [Bacteroidota bacterium]
MAKKTPKKQDESVKEGNLYDKIFKENAEQLFRPLIEEKLNVRFTSFEPMKEKMQTTIEREMDFFYNVVTESGESFILHLEFQTEDDTEMLYRMSEYHGMALRRKRKPIKHLLIFLGKGKSKMKTKLPAAEVFTGFEIINIFKLSTEALLASQIPSYIVSAILTDIKADKVESVLRLILIRLKEVCKNKSELSRYQKQLLILSRLRKFEDTAIKIVKDMPITYDIETDYLYKKGIEKGIEKGIGQGIERGENLGIDQQATVTIISLLLKTDFPIEQIANLAVVSLDSVKKWTEALAQTRAKLIWQSFGTLNERKQAAKITERAVKLARALCTIPSLTDKVIAKVCSLSEEQVKQLRPKPKHPEKE